MRLLFCSDRKDFMNFGFLILVAILFAPSLRADCPAFELPAVSQATERIFAKGTSTDFTDTLSGQYLGVVDQRVLHLTKTFELNDPHGVLIARARARFFALGAAIDVTDCDNRPIGTIEENIFQSIIGFGITNEFLIRESSGRVIAKSEKFQLFGTEVKLLDEQNRLVSVISRPYINFFRDVWTLALQHPGKVDSRVLAFMPAFKTASDRSHSSSGSSGSDRKSSR